MLEANISSASQAHHLLSLRQSLQPSSEKAHEVKLRQSSANIRRRINNEAEVLIYTNTWSELKSTAYSVIPDFQAEAVGWLTRLALTG